jgi:hypothetical protein
VEYVAVQGLLKHVLRRNVGGVQEVGRAGARNGRLRTIRETRRNFARDPSVLGKAQRAVGIRMGSRKAVCFASLETG